MRPITLSKKYRTMYLLITVPLLIYSTFTAIQLNVSGGFFINFNILSMIFFVVCIVILRNKIFTSNSLMYWNNNSFVYNTTLLKQHRVVISNIIEITPDHEKEFIYYLNTMTKTYTVNLAMYDITSKQFLHNFSIKRTGYNDDVIYNQSNQ